REAGAAVGVVKGGITMAIIKGNYIAGNAKGGISMPANADPDIQENIIINNGGPAIKLTSSLLMLLGLPETTSSDQLKEVIAILKTELQAEEKVERINGINLFSNNQVNLEWVLRIDSLCKSLIGKIF